MHYNFGASARHSGDPAMEAGVAITFWSSPRSRSESRPMRQVFRDGFEDVFTLVLAVLILLGAAALIFYPRPLVSARSSTRPGKHQLK